MVDASLLTMIATLTFDFFYFIVLTIENHQ